MARTYVRQETQIRKSDLYDDQVAPSEANYETNTVNIEDDLNALRSQVHNILSVQGANWYDDLAVPSSFTGEGEAKRGVDQVNSDLHVLERKRFLNAIYSQVDVTVNAGDNYVVLGTGELPAQTTMAVGAVDTLGTVCAAHGGTFGTHALSEIASGNPLSPFNLLVITDGASGDEILSDGRVVYGLLQSENASDGHTATDTTPNRLQISFVRRNATNDDLEAVPFADIENAAINYCTREQVGFEDLPKDAFISDGIVDSPAATTVNRQVAYDNQSSTPVTLGGYNALLNIADGQLWALRDPAGSALFFVNPTSGTNLVGIDATTDLFRADAGANDFANGIQHNTDGARPINVGVTDGVINSTAGDLQVEATAELLLEDGNRSGSTFSAPVKLSDTTAEWDAYEAAFGTELSLLAAITDAKTSVGNFSKTCANVIANENADVDIGGVGGGTNLDAQLHDLSGGAFVDDHDVYLNGRLQRGGADAAANNDVYPGTSLANGQLRFEKKVKSGDVICVISRA